MTTPIERAAEALMSPVHAPMTDHDPRDGSCVSCPWPLSEAGTPEEIARAVFESIDREGLIDVLVMSPLSDSAGTDMRPVERTADAIRAWLLSEGGA